jgi:hypothetical protein
MHAPTTGDRNNNFNSPIGAGGGLLPCDSNNNKSSIRLSSLKSKTGNFAAIATQTSPSLSEAQPILQSNEKEESASDSYNCVQFESIATAPTHETVAADLDEQMQSKSCTNETKANHIEKINN